MRDGKICMTRRFFIGGASAFGALGAFGGLRFAPAGRQAAGGKPRLRFGVISDVHISREGVGETITDYGNDLTLRHALAWFRDQDVDAVVLAGDMADNGTVHELEIVGRAWDSVFPDSRVARLFVYGNHDTPKWPPADRISDDLAGAWEKAFHEAYEPIWTKEVKGYRFVGAHWTQSGCIGRNDAFNAGIGDFYAGLSGKIDPKLPFFHIQHPHPKGTCYGDWAWGSDDGLTTRTLSRFPNAISFSGHSHYSLTDERSIWQGAFTSVGTASLRNVFVPRDSRPHGFENTEVTNPGDWALDAAKMLPVYRGGDCRQGMLWSVYDDRITVRRREFLSDFDLGEDWTLPLPAAESKPFAFAERARRLAVPEFDPMSRMTVFALTAKTRGRTSPDGMMTIASVKKEAVEVTAPAPAKAGAARLFEIEFTAEGANGKTLVKNVVANGYNQSREHRRAGIPTRCVFARDELPAGKVRFSATPMNSYWGRGKTVRSNWCDLSRLKQKETTKGKSK